jgi:flagellar hook-associated protein 3 FlgL
MINSINPSADSFLVNIHRLQEKAERAQQQIGSGLRIINASDDPDEVGALVEAGSHVARNTQIARNLDRTKSEVDGAELALSTAITTLEKISVLGTQGANFNQTAAARSQIASEVTNLLGQLVGNANTNVERRYVFNGDTDQIAPYSIDLTTLTGTTPYAGTPSTRQVEDPRGGTFSISQTAQDIFDAPGGPSVFGAVNDLRVALLANDQDAIATAAGALQGAHDHLSDSLAFYGSVQNQVADATAATRVLGLRLTSALGDIRDADLVQASSELVATRLQLDATFSARVLVPQRSLFDFLG